MSEAELRALLLLIQIDEELGQTTSPSELGGIRIDLVRASLAAIPIPIYPSQTRRSQVAT